MSLMVTLGLGDFEPSNLAQRRITKKIPHQDIVLSQSNENCCLTHTTKKFYSSLDFLSGNTALIFLPFNVNLFAVMQYVSSLPQFLLVSMFVLGIPKCVFQVTVSWCKKEHMLMPPDAIHMNHRSSWFCLCEGF